MLAEFGADGAARDVAPSRRVDLIDMMRGVVDARHRHARSKTRFGITGDVAGKTGTTQNNTDGWFILMHPQPGGRRLGRLQRLARDDAQRLLGPGRPQRDPAGRRLLEVACRGTRLINAKAELPAAAPAGAAAIGNAVPDPWAIEIDRNDRTEQLRPRTRSARSARPTEVIVVRNENGTITIGDKASITTSRRAGGSAEERRASSTA